ncbi:MAG: recombinase family protein [Clostridiales Family XIII bacterium]|nr:recombinase family protein [Clostridiales Family XIII bacterium]
MKAVIYARYSSDNQREESIEGQLRECKEFAERNEFTIVETYIDRAQSARTDHRSEFQRMIKESSKKCFDVAIVWKLDRFARNRLDSAKYKAILRKNGVRVVSAKESIAEDSTGILLESMLEGYAEFFSAELSEKVIRGMTENALKGKYNGRQVPLGFKVNKDMYYEIDPLTAPIVVDIYTRYADGENMKDIADSLNNKGIRAAHGGKFTQAVLSNMLKNRKYIGESKFRDTVVPDKLPRIISDILFQRVHKRLEKNRYAPAHTKPVNDKYLLSTKLRCGYCGAFMVGESGKNRMGNIYRYYKCTSAKKLKMCSRKAVKKDWIEEIVLKHVVETLLDDKLINQIADRIINAQAKENEEGPLLKKQLDVVDRNIENLIDAIQDGLHNKSTKDRLDKLEDRKAELEIAIVKEKIQREPIPKEYIINWIRNLRSIDTSDYLQKERLIDAFVNAVYVYDDKIVFTFNCRDGTEAVSIEQIEDKCSDLKTVGVPK